MDLQRSKNAPETVQQMGSPFEKHKEVACSSATEK